MRNLVALSYMKNLKNIYSFSLFTSIESLLHCLMLVHINMITLSCIDSGTQYCSCGARACLFSVYSSAKLHLKAPTNLPATPHKEQPALTSQHRAAPTEFTRWIYTNFITGNEQKEPCFFLRNITLNYERNAPLR